ncbi:hypothetical protein N0V93_008292 [Gnomoniopsis smithogilvyi]|uniref:2EXR domain-containing protein n=1 Tax=Gnomoniopsis smithogilvyi TaxID=1191159 RepID=A0A9W9CUL7_9PEZI|nr:hypothetical protein N0V93_008292 [Gnomoniopsis smithogilvyi]
MVVLAMVQYVHNPDQEERKNMAVFADLPAELRIQIWELCVHHSVEPGVFVWGTGTNRKKADYYQQRDVPFPRVRKRRYPLVTNTCSESRHHLLSPSVADRYHIGQDHRPLDPDIDIIFLRWPAHLHRMRMVIKLAIKYGNPQPWPARVTRLALSQECADLCHNNIMFGTDFERWRLFETLLCHQRALPQRALREVSLVHVGSEVDLDVPDPLVELAEWTPARSTMHERETLLTMRARLAKELEAADRAWAYRPHRQDDAAAEAPEGTGRTALCVKRMVIPGSVTERSRWKMRMASMARWWVRQSQAAT